MNLRAAHKRNQLKPWKGKEPLDPIAQLKIQHYLNERLMDAGGSFQGNNNTFSCFVLVS